MRQPVEGVTSRGAATTAPNSSSSPPQGVHSDLHSLVALVVCLGAAAAGVAAHGQLHINLQGMRGGWLLFVPAKPAHSEPPDPCRPQVTQQVGCRQPGCWLGSHATCSSHIAAGTPLPPPTPTQSQLVHHTPCAYLLDAVKVLDGVGHLVLAVRLDGGRGLDVAPLHHDACRGGCASGRRSKEGGVGHARKQVDERRRRRGPDPALQRDRPRRQQIETRTKLGRVSGGLGQASGSPIAGGCRVGQLRFARSPSATVSTDRRATRARCWGAGRKAGAAA